MKVGIYQIYYSELTGRNIDPAFIPYYNDRRTQFFENDVIMDLYQMGRHKLWDRIGILSWRFMQKTGISGDRLMDIVNAYPNIDVFNFSPKPFLAREEHPYNRKRFPAAVELAAMIDKRNILPFKLWHYDTGGINFWCNYWVTKPEHFEKFCRDYLKPLMDYLNDPDPEIDAKLKKGYAHRDNGVLYTVIPFFLEGLFSVFCHREKLTIVIP